MRPPLPPLPRPVARAGRICDHRAIVDDAHSGNGSAALVERLFGASIAAFDVLSVYLGDRLGLYARLGDRACTSSELAEAAGIHERYAREWLEQQAATGILAVDAETGDAATRRYRLPVEHREPLLDSDSFLYVTPLARTFAGAIRPLPELLDAFRTGAGVPFAAYGEDLVDGQAGFTRPLFLRRLGQEWLPAVPDVHRRLLADPPARVADVACGGGLSSIAIARAYPKVHVDGIDADEESIALARRHLAGSGVEGRVEFHQRDARDSGLAAGYDLVTVFEALHDMSRPVDVLAALRGLLADGGTVLVGDERAEEAFAAPATELERLLYGFSVFHCLPVGMVGDDPVGTGTVMRPATVREYANAAGFSGFEVLPIEDDFWRFYRLTP